MRKFLYIVGGIALLALAGWLVWQRVSTPDTGTLLYTSQGPVLSQAERALLPNGFPVPYILGRNTRVTAGGIEDMPDGSSRFWVTASSPEKPDVFIAQYRALFDATGWTISTANVPPPNAAIAATKDTRQLVITAQVASGGTLAHIVYTGSLWGIASSPTP